MTWCEHITTLVKKCIHHFREETSS